MILTNKKISLPHVGAGNESIHIESLMNWINI